MVKVISALFKENRENYDYYISGWNLVFTERNLVFTAFSSFFWEKKWSKWGGFAIEIWFLVLFLFDFHKKTRSKGADLPLKSSFYCYISFAISEKTVKMRWIFHWNMVLMLFDFHKKNRSKEADLQLKSSFYWYFSSVFSEKLVKMSWISHWNLVFDIILDQILEENQIKRSGFTIEI